MTKKQYTIRGPHGNEQVTYCPEKSAVRKVNGVDKSYYVELEDINGVSGYKVTWNNALSCGVCSIPDAVFYDLPALMAILNQARGYTIFEPVDIYSELPIATLFKESNND